MEKIDIEKNEKYFNAQKRIREIKGFYYHLYVYLIINTMLSLIKVVSNIYDGSSFSDTFFEFSTFRLWFFWGIGLAIHAFNVFGFNFLFGKNWEERKIKQFMDEESDKIKNI